MSARRKTKQSVGFGARNKKQAAQSEPLLDKQLRRLPLASFALSRGPHEILILSSSKPPFGRVWLAQNLYAHPRERVKKGYLFSWPTRGAQRQTKPTTTSARQASLARTLCGTNGKSFLPSLRSASLERGSILWPGASRPSEGRTMSVWQVENLRQACREWRWRRADM